MNALAPVSRSLSTNPLKSSAPLGAAMAFLGVEGAVPLFHGSQGCTAFALVLLVRHFKEAIPLQTTAMNEVSTILGGADHVEEALLNLKKRMNPKLVGICSTALTETRGEDFEGDLRLILTRRAEELSGTEVVFASTPDFNGALEEGWSRATVALIDALVPAKGWQGYRAFASYDLDHWFRVPTDYDGTYLTIRHAPERDGIYYAYFPAYTAEPLRRLVGRCQADPRCRAEVLGRTVDGEELDLLTIGQPGRGRKAGDTVRRARRCGGGGRALPRPGAFRTAAVRNS